MLPKNWEIKEKQPKNIIETLLINRGITDKETFFNPPDPLEFSLKELGIAEKLMKSAILRIKKAKTKKECVVIYGDYDIDGVCATSLMWQTLHEYGLNVYPFVPDRFEDGYGMTNSGIEKICKKYPEVSLIVTVDNGIVAHKAIKTAQERGIEVVVTDHHEKSGKNKANALVHTTMICGTALAWVFARELLKDAKFLTRLLDLVGIATIGDQMKLVGVNRAFAYHGFKEIRKSSRIGLLALCEVSQVDIKNVGAYEIGFVLGPRMNAAGRLANGIDVVRLLCTKSRARAYEISSSLNELNIQRQKVTTEVLLLARESLGSQERVIVVSGQFHEGVIGLAAGKLVEETGKPALVFSVGDKHVKGSARSISGFHITNALRTFESLMINVGGHEMAAGMTIEVEKFPVFLKEFSNYIKDSTEINVSGKKVLIDCELDFEKVNLELANEISLMEPFGMGNPRPTFLTTKATIGAFKYLGAKKEHVKLSLKIGENTLEALVFQIARLQFLPKLGEKLDVVYSIDKNTWNGRSNVQLMIKDFHEYKSRKKQSVRGRISKT